ncbi:MAG: ABC transporter ATP-binding protein [Euryarchaeota archaeon]|nr:ABC transporter ATP-binding protein [Euryarchaeota archaeon]
MSEPMVLPPPPPPGDTTRTSVRSEEGLEAVQSKAEPGKELLLSAWNIQKHFPLRGGVLSTRVGEVRAVDGITFDIRRGETVGLVGESGCGKTTAGRLLLRLIEPTRGHTFYFDPEKPFPADIEQRLQSLYDGLEKLIPPGVVDRGAALRSIPAAQPILKQLDALAAQYSLYRKGGHEMRRMRGKMQIVFQDPFSSLSPRMLVRDIVSEPLAVHHVGSRKQRYQRVGELLASVGLNPEHVWRFPHEFSGGQRQRIGIARALALRPDFIVLDEPTSALDVSVQAQILNILLRLQREQRLSYLFISHHLSVVRAISHRVVVMYLGKVVERAPTEELFEHPLHPYTQALLSAIPIPDPTLKRERIILSGDVPSPAAPPSGCRFHTRCPKVMQVCSKVEPPLMTVGGRADHVVACHLYSEQGFPELGLLGSRSPAVIGIPAGGPAVEEPSSSGGSLGGTPNLPSVPGGGGTDRDGPPGPSSDPTSPPTVPFVAAPEGFSLQGPEPPPPPGPRVQDPPSSPVPAPFSLPPPAPPSPPLPSGTSSLAPPSAPTASDPSPPPPASRPLISRGRFALHSSSSPSPPPTPSPISSELGGTPPPAPPPSRTEGAAQGAPGLPNSPPATASPPPPPPPLSGARRPFTFASYTHPAPRVPAPEASPYALQSSQPPPPPSVPPPPPPAADLGFPSEPPLPSQEAREATPSLPLRGASPPPPPEPAPPWRVGKLSESALSPEEPPASSTRPRLRRESTGGSGSP